MSDELLETITKRNPGALRVYFEIAEGPTGQALLTYAELLEKKIAPRDLWDLYKACDYSVTKLYESLVAGTAIATLQQVPGSSFWQGGQEG